MNMNRKWTGAVLSIQHIEPLRKPDRRRIVASSVGHAGGEWGPGWARIVVVDRGDDLLPAILLRHVRKRSRKHRPSAVFRSAGNLAQTRNLSHLGRIPLQNLWRQSLQVSSFGLLFFIQKSLNFIFFFHFNTKIIKFYHF